MGMAEDRQNSLLTKANRELITSEPEHSALERKQRARMRNRVENGLIDISLLNQHARPEDIRQIFHRENEGNAAHPEQDFDERPEAASNLWVFARHTVAFLWRGLRLNDVEKNTIFERVIIRGIEDGEADYAGVPHGWVDSDIRFNQLEVVEEADELDPVEKWQRDLSLSSDDFQEITERLSQHPEVESIAGEDIGELIDRYLVEE